MRYLRHKSKAYAAHRLPRAFADDDPDPQHHAQPAK
jgi:hypothetical protein